LLARRRFGEPQTHEDALAGDRQVREEKVRVGRFDPLQWELLLQQRHSRDDAGDVRRDEDEVLEQRLDRPDAFDRAGHTG